VNLGDHNTIDKNLNDHITAFMKGRSSFPTQNTQSKWANRDVEILEKLNNAMYLTDSTFRENIISEEHDHVVFIYSSDKTSANYD
jgi:hypothetical protein